MNLWERLTWQLRGWQTFPLPNAEYVPVPKSRRNIPTTRIAAWPDTFKPLATRPPRPWEISPEGHGGGIPMQLGGPTSTALKVGTIDIDGIRVVTVPRPKLGFWWVEGYPLPTYDRHLIIHATNGDVLEFFGFDAAPAFRWPWTTDAVACGVWRGGKLIAGSASVTASKLPHHPYLWSPWSASEGGHTLSLVVPDYHGGDGLLPAGAPKAGSRVALSRDTDSYRSNYTLGGECAAMAESMAEFGAVLIDRNSYADVPAAERMKRTGKVPHEPTVSVQSGAQWKGTNVGRFQVRLGDLREVVE